MRLLSIHENVMTCMMNILATTAGGGGEQSEAAGDSAAAPAETKVQKSNTTEPPTLKTFFFVRIRQSWLYHAANSCAIFAVRHAKIRRRCLNICPSYWTTPPCYWRDPVCVGQFHWTLHVQASQITMSFR